MNIKKFGLGVAITLMTTLGHASAATVLNSDVTGGWSQGTGTSNGAFTLDEANGIELGLRASIRGGGGGPVTPIAGTNVYEVPIGTAGSPARALWNFDFSVNTGGQTGLTALLTVSNGANTTSFDPLSSLLGNTTNPVGAQQNSENLTFGFLSGLNFDPTALTTYTFDLTLRNAAGGVVSDVEIEVAAVPEPSTWAMMILGFCGVGFMAYRKKSTLRFA
jgi:hypothetical protein